MAAAAASSASSSPMSNRRRFVAKNASLTQDLCVAASPSTGRTLVARRLETGQIGLVASGQMIYAVVLRFGDTVRVDWDIDWCVLYYDLLRPDRVVAVGLRLRIWESASGRFASRYRLSSNGTRPRLRCSTV